MSLTNVLGIRNNNTIIPLTAATKATKTVDNSILSLTGGDGAVVSYAHAYAWADSNNVWWIHINTRVTLPSITGAAFTFGSSNVIFDATMAQTGAVYGSYAGSNQCQVLVPANGSIFTIYDAGTNAGNYAVVSITAKLKQAPTWAAANMEGVANVAAYFPPADASTTGLLTNAAQTIAGDKTLTGFTSLGGDLALKCKYLSWTTSGSEGGSTTIAHGLTGDKIVAFTPKVAYATNSGISVGHTADVGVGYEFFCSFDATNFTIQLHSTNSENILTKPIGVLVWYIA